MLTAIAGVIVKAVLRPTGTTRVPRSTPRLRRPVVFDRRGQSEGITGALMKAVTDESLHDAACLVILRIDNE